MSALAHRFALSLYRACLKPGQPHLDCPPLPQDLAPWLLVWEAEGLRGLCVQRLFEEPSNRTHGDLLKALLWQEGHHQIAGRELNRLLLASPVPVIVFKGHGTTGKLYHRGAARTSRDIDLLVGANHVAEFRKFLVQEGYRQHREFAHLFSRPPHHLDVHTQLFAHVPWAIGLQARDVWQSAIGTQGAGLRLCPTHEFLFVLAHAVTHGFGRLIWLMDLAQLQTVLGRRESQELAESHGMSRAFRWMEAVQRGLLEEQEAADGSWGWAEKFLLGRVLARKSGDRTGRFFLALGIPSLKGRCAYLGRLIWGQEQSWARFCRLFKAFVRG